MKKCCSFIALVILTLSTNAQENYDFMEQVPLSYGFDHPQDSARTKIWWFHGNTETTLSGITADLEAFKAQGIGGVVYYDQVHGNPQNADKLFSVNWWRSVIFAAQEAKRLGLQFDVNITNGYAAGGSWITPDKSIQRLVATKCK